MNIKWIYWSHPFSSLVELGSAIEPYPTRALMPPQSIAGVASEGAALATGTKRKAYVAEAPSLQENKCTLVTIRIKMGVLLLMLLESIFLEIRLCNESCDNFPNPKEVLKQRRSQKCSRHLWYAFLYLLLKVECLLTSAIWSYGHEAEVYIFLNLPFPSNPKENSSICCIWSTPEQNLLWHIIGCTPNTFHNTINKNVNHSNDTIDNLNQSSFHKPACQCQGHHRTESLSASAHILHCGKIRPCVVRSGFRCASADLRQSRYLHVAR